MFGKVLVANRGEIAIRAFRAAYELGAATVAVFPYEDRTSLHRLKADESYQIGEPGHPVRAYLSVDEMITAARWSGADAIYPGYGFLSENPQLAWACRQAGIAFVGPSPEVLELTGNKAHAVTAARAAGLPGRGPGGHTARAGHAAPRRGRSRTWRGGTARSRAASRGWGSPPRPPPPPPPGGRGPAPRGSRPPATSATPTPEPSSS